MKLKESTKKDKQITSSKVAVTFDIKEDLKSFKPESKKVLQLEKEDQTLRNLFLAP